jgi:hypothetical protein
MITAFITKVFHNRRRENMKSHQPPVSFRHISKLQPHGFGLLTLYVTTREGGKARGAGRRRANRPEKPFIEQDYQILTL